MFLRINYWHALGVLVLGLYGACRLHAERAARHDGRPHPGLADLGVVDDARRLGPRLPRALRPALRGPPPSLVRQVQGAFRVAPDRPRRRRQGPRAASFFVYFYRARRYAGVVYAVVACPSVCPSVRHVTVCSFHCYFMSVCPSVCLSVTHVVVVGGCSRWQVWRLFTRIVFIHRYFIMFIWL